MPSSAITKFGNRFWVQATKTGMASKIIHFAKPLLNIVFLPFSNGAREFNANFWLYVFILIKIIDYVKKLDQKSPIPYKRGWLFE